MFNCQDKDRDLVIKIVTIGSAQPEVQIMTELCLKLPGTYPEILDSGKIDADTAMMLNLEENLEFIIMEKLGSSFFSLISKCGGYPFTKKEVLNMGI